MEEVSKEKPGDGAPDTPQTSAEYVYWTFVVFSIFYLWNWTSNNSHCVVFSLVMPVSPFRKYCQRSVVRLTVLRKHKKLVAILKMKSEVLSTVIPIICVASFPLFWILDFPVAILGLSGCPNQRAHLWSRINNTQSKMCLLLRRSQMPPCNQMKPRMSKWT